MIIRPRATSLRISSGSSFSRFATYSISSVITPCRAKCICETLRPLDACVPLPLLLAAATAASRFSIQLSRNPIKPPQKPQPASRNKKISRNHDAPVLKSNYGTWGWTRQLRDAQILNRQHVCHDGFLVGSGSGMEGSQVLAETRRASLFASGSASGFASACVSISPIVSTPVDVLESEAEPRAEAWLVSVFSSATRTSIGAGFGR